MSPAGPLTPDYGIPPMVRSPCGC